MDKRSRLGFPRKGQTLDKTVVSAKGSGLMELFLRRPRSRQFWKGSVTLWTYRWPRGPNRMAQGNFPKEIPKSCIRLVMYDAAELLGFGIQMPSTYFDRGDCANLSRSPRAPMDRALSA